MGRKIRSIAFIVIVGITSLLLYGRASGRINVMEKLNTNDASTSISLIPFPESFDERINDKLWFDVVVDGRGCSSGQVYYKTTAEIDEFDKEVLLDLFWEADETKYDTVEWYDDLGNSIEEYQCEKGDKILYVGDDVLTMAMNDLWLYISEPATDEILCKKRNAQLQEFTKDNAWGLLQNTFQEGDLNKEELHLLAYYGLDKDALMESEETLCQIDAVYEDEKKQEWLDSDEGYQFYFAQASQGIPLYPETKVLGGSDFNDSDSQGKAYVTRDGIASLYIRWWGCFTQTEEKKGQLLPVEQILHVVEEKYCDMSYTDPLEIYAAKLYLIPMQIGKGQYELEPVWIVYGQEHMKGEDGEEYINMNRIQIPINAITGEEMYDLER